MKYLPISMLLTLTLSFQGLWAASPISMAATQEKQSTLTPQRALELLKEGNKRFLSNTMRDYDFAKEMKKTTQKGQHPIAVILSCIDSRSIPEFLFDQGLGNLFVSRIAGNVADKDLLGSMEFATKLAGSKLVVVMGHTHCGAVVGACTTRAQTDLYNLNALLIKIKPAVMHVKNAEKNTFSCKKELTIEQITKQNVLNQMQYVKNNSPVIAQQLKDKQINLVGAMHNIKTGNVEFFDAQGEPLM